MCVHGQENDFIMNWNIGNVLVCVHFSSKLAHGTYRLYSITQLFRLPMLMLKPCSGDFNAQNHALNFVTFLVASTDATPYIRFILGFQYGRFSCDGSRFLYIIIMHCIVNVENHQL